MNILFSEENRIREKKYKKIKCLGITNQDFRNKYIFKSSQSFFCFLRQFLINLGFEKDFFVEGIGRPVDENSEGIIKGKEVDIHVMNSLVENYKNKYYSIDIFYTNKKIYLIINYRDKKKHYKIVKAIEDLVNWSE